MTLDCWSRPPGQPTEPCPDVGPFAFPPPELNRSHEHDPEHEPTEHHRQHGWQTHARGHFWCTQVPQCWDLNVSPRSRVTTGRPWLMMSFLMMLFSSVPFDRSQ